MDNRDIRKAEKSFPELPRNKHQTNLLKEEEEHHHTIENQKTSEQSEIHSQVLEPDGHFDWIKGSRQIQHVSQLNGTINDNNWEDVIREMRNITGGTGTTYTDGPAFEWEQLKKTSYRHIALTPEQDKTNVQFVCSWTVLKMIVTLLSFIVPFILTAVILDNMAAGNLTRILSAVLAGVVGFPVGRFILKLYFNKQKKQLQDILEAALRILKQS
ncbi:MAG: hypothetical protein FH748_17025 [Balneolaceae bacterium]|nr:hypothetical protein [Balneolaceae bacterium]